MDLVIKDLPRAVENKIKALHILSEGRANLNSIFSDAIKEKLNVALAEQLTAEDDSAYHGYSMGSMPAPQQPVVEQGPVVKQQQSMSVQQTLRSVQQPVSQGRPSDFIDGLGDVYEDSDPELDGPEPPPDEDDEGVITEADDFDDLVNVGDDDIDDDDSLYSDAAGSYNPKPPVKQPSNGQHPASTKKLTDGPIAADLGLPDLSTDAFSMGFFDAQLNNGTLPSYARVPRAMPQETEGIRRPASLPMGESLSPEFSRKKPRVKISGAK
jgi:hypothetical protein